MVPLNEVKGQMEDKGASHLNMHILSVSQTVVL